ncbi:MAG TPA: polyamine aminopropyltransferase [Alphaproteobacteria bacterium]|nr:polyamine aminopropyltransferase [Alphaproteobacteria bacterium]
MDWYRETLYPEVSQSFKVERIIHREKTEHQDLVIFENKAMGRVLALDGVIQTTEGDEFFYHEMMGHVPLIAHGAAKRALIIGGGDGGLLEEVLKHRGLEQVVMVEIDPHVIELSKKYLPSIPGAAFEDARAEIVIADGATFVAETEERFDVVMVDSTDPHGPGEVLFTSEFYGNCKRCMNPGGIMVTQNGVPFFQPEELSTSWKRLTPVFPDVSFYVVPVPTYYGGFMTLGWASLDPRYRTTPVHEIERRIEAAALATKYYNAAIHQACFALPNYARARLR